MKNYLLLCSHENYQSILEENEFHEIMVLSALTEKELKSNGVYCSNLNDIEFPIQLRSRVI